MATRTAFRVPFAVKLWNSWSLFRKEVPSGAWGGASKSPPSLRSVREPGVGGCVTRYVQTTEIPPAGAPPGGGVRLCGNVWLLRPPLHPVCRFAQDDTWVTGARDGKQNAVSVRKVKCRVSQKKCHICKKSKTPYHSVSLYYILHQTYMVPRPCNPLCHPERSGTTNQYSRAPTNHCRAVEPRPKRGASRRDLLC